MALRSSQPVTEMDTRTLPGDERWPASKADSLTTVSRLSRPAVFNLFFFFRLTPDVISLQLYTPKSVMDNSSYTQSIIYI
jgi:hypothetical protein